MSVSKSVAVKAAIESLEAWATSGAPSPTQGICTNLDIAINCEDINWYFVVGCTAMSWPHYSGSLCYPVPPHGYSSPKEAFEKEKLWEGAYGALRKNLCKHIANYLKERPNTPLRPPCPGDKVWCNIEGVRMEGEVLRVSENTKDSYPFWTSCDGGQCPIDAEIANKEWGFIE